MATESIILIMTCNSLLCSSGSSSSNNTIVEEEEEEEEVFIQPWKYVNIRWMKQYDLQNGLGDLQ